MGGYPGFIPQASTANPYIGAAAEGGSSAAHLAASLRAAADQQTQLQQQAKNQQATRLHQAFEDRLKMLTDGGVPAEIVTEDSSGLKTRKPNPALPTDADPSRFVPDPTSPTNQRIYMPTDAQREKAKESGKPSYTTSGALGQQFEDYLGVKNGTTFPAETLPHLLQALHDAEPEGQEPETSIKAVDANGNPVALMRGKKSGKLSVQQLPEGVSPAPAKEPTQKSLRWERNENDAGDVVLRAFDPETGDEIRKFTYKGEARKKKDPDAEPAQKPPSPAQFRQIETNKQNALAKAKTNLSKALSEAVTPEDRQAATSDYRSALAAAQTGYEAEIAAVTGKDPGHNPWADAPAKQQTDQPQASAPKSAKPVAAPAAAKTGKQPVTMQHVRSYAKQKGVSEAQAIREFKDYGYTIAGGQ